MNLKPFVNNKELYSDFQVEINNRIKQHQKDLESAREIEVIYRHQGSIIALRRLLTLREKVNGS